LSSFSVEKEASGDFYELAAVSADGNSIAFDDYGKAVVEFLDRQRFIHLPYETTADVEHHLLSAAFTSDGRNLCVVYPDGKVIVWDLLTAQQKLSWSLGKVSLGIVHGFNNGVDFSANCQMMASGDYGHFIDLWEMQTGIVTSVFHYPEQYWLDLLRLSADGKLLVGGSFFPADPDYIFAWDVQSGKEMAIFTIPQATTLDTLLGNDNWPRDIAISPDNAIIATRSENLILRLWDPVAQKLLVERDISGSKWLSFSQDGKYLFSLSDDGVMQIWGIPTATPQPFF
jgi:WD40 repeat protein